MALLISVYAMLMSLFLLEDQAVITTLAENFYSLSIYKPY